MRRRTRRRVARIRRAGRAKSTSSRLDLGLIQDVMALMERGQLSRFEYVQGGLRIHLEKAPSPISGYLPPVAASLAPQAPVVIPAPVAPAPVAAVPVAAPAPAPAAPVAAPAGKFHPITSPMVGTFYSSPSPGADPFVSVGSRVDKDKVVCIVEAMKLMNEIKAGVSGTISEILVDNADPVEFGQELFRVRPE